MKHFNSHRREYATKKEKERILAWGLNLLSLGHSECNRVIPVNPQHSSNGTLSNTVNADWLTQNMVSELRPAFCFIGRNF